MRYLKKFESLRNKNVDKLVDLTENYLAYLIDYGLKFEINDSNPINKGQLEYIYILLKPNLLWEDIRPTFLSYLEVIMENYELYPQERASGKRGFISIKGKGENSGAESNLTADEVFNTDIRLDGYIIERILFRIKIYKTVKY